MTGVVGVTTTLGVEFKSRTLLGSTVIATESESVRVPPVPVEPRSLVVIESDAAPA